MFGITTATEFFDKVKDDYEAFAAERANPGKAINCILSLYHLHEWVWATWLKRNEAAKAALTISEKDDLLDFLDFNCPHFRLLQELANGTKHCKPVQSTRRVAGWGMGPWGIGPRGKPYLLIDLGEERPPKTRYLVGFEVIRQIMAFWTQFFRKYNDAG